MKQIFLLLLATLFFYSAEEDYVDWLGDDQEFDEEVYEMPPGDYPIHPGINKEEEDE